MAPPDSPNGGLVDSARRILDSGLAMLQSRFELFATEFQEEKLRLLDLLIWSLVGVVLGVLTLLMVTATIVFIFWDSAPMLVLSLGTLVYAVATVCVFRGLNSRLKTAPRAFADTIAEFNKDREWLQKKN